MKRFKGKVVVITGAGSGIGRALAVDFAQRGALLALSDIKEEELYRVSQELSRHTQVFSQVFDVGEESAMQSFALAVHEHYQRIDVVVNNAGVAQVRAEFSEIKSKDFDWLMNINFGGVIYGSRYFLPYLRQQKESSLVNISSIFGIIGVPSQTSYNASKFAVRGFSAALALEEQGNKTGVVVSCVHPGGIKTNILRNARGVDLERAAAQEKFFRMLPSKAAEVIIKGIKKKKNRILVGKDAYLLHYVNKILRKLVQKAILYTYNKTNP
ncbi:MAG: SDR family oxidoreductase [Aureispira sp.]